MNHNEMVNYIVADLQMGYDLALLVNNDILKDYVKNRLKDVKENQKIYQYVSLSTLVDSYVVDLSLFINISNVVHEVESKDYFKSRLITLMRKFPYLKERRDLIALV